MTIPQRLAALPLVTGAIAFAIAVPWAMSHGAGAKELPWFVGTAVFLLAGAYTWWRLPDHPVARWFAATGGLVVLTQSVDLPVHRLGLAGEAEPLAWALLAFNVGMAAGGVAIAHLLGLFPSGRVERPYERRVLRASWWVLALPGLVFIGRPTLLTPSYHQIPDIPNPYHIPALTPIGEAAGVGVVLLQGVFAIGVVLLALRYRRGNQTARRRIRWLLLPALFTAIVAVADVVAWRSFPDGPSSLFAEVVGSGLWVAAIASLPIAISVALLRPAVVDVDRVLRKSLVYGVLWTLIVLIYVGAAAGLGVAAGQRFPVGVAIVLAVIAAVLFQPARQRLERLADRWVFGTRTDPTQLISRLGETLEETFDLDTLLPRMVSTLEEGLGLRWARVRLEPSQPIDGSGPELTVPIVLHGERLGVVECGPKTSGAFTAEDEAVVASLARQAALAVRNVRLTAALGRQAEELAASRVRLVHAQEAERRRIERDIHDGAQQDLIALIGMAGQVRGRLERDPHAGVAALGDLQAGLRRVITDLRELAHGIHPSLLSDRGLLAAVEALAARSAVPVAVLADPSLREARFAEAIEGAGYFTIAESLTNIHKHAAASEAEVRLARANGSLRLEVRDDGIGFDPATATGDGLRNLAERVSALGGRLDVVSASGNGTTIAATLAVEQNEVLGV